MGSYAQTQLRPVAAVQRVDTDVKLTLPARPENVSVIRHVLGAFAEALRLPDDLVEDLRLAVTEACTNVVRHAYPPDQTALDIFGTLRKLTEAEGRDPKSVGIEVWTSCGAGSASDWGKEAAFWQAAGASHLCLTTTFHRRHHHRIAGKSLSAHLAAAKRYRDAIADVL